MPDWTFDGKAEMQYIGPRFVPRFANPVEWNANKTYEHLEMVTYYGNTYTSRKAVPAGVQPTNTEYWALTGNYNYQVEQYRQTVEGYKAEMEGKIEQYKSDAAENLSDVQNLLQSEIDKKGGLNYGNQNSVYVAGETGNDNYNGSRNNPYKTLDRALKNLNNSAGLTVTILESGVYTTATQISNTSLGINFETNDITVIPIDVFFMRHTNLRLNGNNNTNIVFGQEGLVYRFEGLILEGINVEFVGSININNTKAIFNGCSFNGFASTNSDIALQANCVLKNNKNPYKIDTTYLENPAVFYANYQVAYSNIHFRDYYGTTGEDTPEYPITLVAPNSHLDSIVFMYCDSSSVYMETKLYTSVLSPKYTCAFVGGHPSSIYLIPDTPLTNIATYEIYKFSEIKTTLINQNADDWHPISTKALMARNVNDNEYEINEPYMKNDK